MPVIRVSDEVYRKLQMIKERMRHKSMNEAVEYLLERAENPKTFLESLVFWLEDVRSDFKKLVSMLEKLNESLGKTLSQTTRKNK